MRELFLVYQEHGGPWDWSRGLREQDLFPDHARFVDRLVEQGVIVLGGPLNEKDVLLVVEAADAVAARSHFTDDPWVRNGMLTITAVRPWTVLLDGTAQAHSPD